MISTHMKLFYIMTATVMLAACGDQYRYPCQNPDNWNKPLCQKPLCDVNRTCPEHIFKGSDPVRMLPPGAPIPDSLRGLTTQPPVPGPRPSAPLPPLGPCK